MPGVRARENESFEGTMRRFKRIVEKSGVLSEVKKRDRFESESEKKKRAKAAAQKRARKKKLQRDPRLDEDRVISRRGRH